MDIIATVATYLLAILLGVLLLSVSAYLIVRMGSAAHYKSKAEAERAQRNRNRRRAINGEQDAE